MIRVVCTFILLLLPAISRAEIIQITSGEHADFSRLVLSKVNTSNWSVARVDGGFEFQSIDPEDSYDLSRAYERIPRDRLRQIEDLGNGRLFLAVTCDCHANAFIAGDGLVALDIYDGPSPSERLAFNRPRQMPQISTDAARASDNATTSEQTLEPAKAAPPPVKLPLFTTGSSLPHFIEVNGNFPKTEDQPLASPAPEAAPPVRTSAGETEAALLEQIARAASQGLLEAAVSEVQPPAPTMPEQAGSATVVDPEPISPPPISDQSHVSITTSIDLANRDLRVIRTDQGNACIPDRYFDISTWGEADGTGVDIGSYRSQIIGEFDETDGSGVNALIRNYIYITFGAEAKALLDRYRSDVERADVLEMMADVMDEGQSNSAIQFNDQLACDGPAALWAAAAQPTLYKYQPIDGAAVRLAFGALPPHLRRHIGPTLAGKFLAIGDKVTAEALRDATARVVTEPLPELTLLEARTDLANDIPDRARDRLDDVVQQADDLLPEALIERVEAALANGEAVPEDVISLVESVGFEHRGTSTGAALARAEIRALASASHFEEAFSRFDGARMDGTVSGEEAVDLSREIFSLLVVNASDQEFLTRTVAWLEEASALRATDRRALALRLLDLGFADQARDILGKAGDVPSMEDRLIFARIALAQQKPQVAVGYLAGLAGEEVLRLRAMALSTAKDYAGAMQSFGELGDGDARDREAWRGGYWEDLATRDEGPFGATSRLLTTDDVPSAEDAPTLGRDAALIETSQMTRETIDALFTALDEDAANSQSGK